MFNFVCEACGHREYTTKGYNSNRTKRRLVCKNCGKNTNVDIAQFEIQSRSTVSPTVSAPVHEVETVSVPSDGSFLSTVNVQNAQVVASPEVPIITADLENERREDREPNVPKIRMLNINGQTGAFPNFTEAMVEAYARAENHTLEYRDGVYYLTAKRGSKG